MQRVFLSHNSIECINSISCLFEVKLLIELSLDGNPIADSDHGKYRNEIIASIPGLRHLDLKRITEDERKAAISYRTKLAETVRQESKLCYCYV